LTSQNWIDLNEFSAKYKISLSTLRRRIRFGEIENLFRDGKYWVPDQPVPKHLKSKEPAKKFIAAPASHSQQMPHTLQSQVTQPVQPQMQQQSAQRTQQQVARPASVQTAPTAHTQPAQAISQVNTGDQANAELKNLVVELKSAYVTVLHDKEDQITQLKEEVADLKTLVKILESENERLKKLIGQSETELPIIKNWQLGDLDL
jgi:hypothetical protein